MGTRALAVKTQPLRVAATAMEWFPNNVARNFPVNLSVIEICLLQFQRFWAQAKTDRRELRARLQERVVRTAHDREAVPRGIIRRTLYLQAVSARECSPANARDSPAQEISVAWWCTMTRRASPEVAGAHTLDSSDAPPSQRTR